MSGSAIDDEPEQPRTVQEVQYSAYRDSAEQFVDLSTSYTEESDVDVQPPDESFSSNPFKPFNDIQASEDNILTFRAVFVGTLFGAIVNASNIYLGLKAGWLMSANIFGSIGGFAVLKTCSMRIPSSYPLGGQFGPHENNIVQTAATAAGGLGTVFVSAIPAMYQLGLLTTPTNDFFRFVTLTATGGYFGLLFSAPLREFFIFKVAKDLQLVFPSSSATAITIRSMHLAADGSSSAWRTMRALAIAFIFAAGLRIVSQYAIGILWDWHIFTWLIASNILADTALILESWGWFFEWTPAFIGSGMLVGLNVAASFTAGSLIAWGIIGPYLVSQGMAFGTPASADPQWLGLMSYNSLSKEFASADHPSPRYWLLWPGVACMIAVAFTELALYWRVFWVLGRNLFTTVKQSFNRFSASGYRYRPLSPGQSTSEAAKDDIQYWMWLPWLVVVIVMTCVITKVQYEMPILETLLALLLSAILSLTVIQATGATDTSPLGTVSKVTQIVLGSTTRGSPNLQASQSLNLLGGSLATIGANMACDLIGDFRVGYLLNTPPGVQYLTQMIGTTFAAIIAPTVFIMFATGYPCILDAESNEKCPFAVPAVTAWRAVAVAATADELPIPSSSLKFSIVMAVIGVTSVLLKHYVWVGRWEGAKKYHPNLMIISLAFTLPATQFAIAMLIGAVTASVWKKKDAKSFEIYSYAIVAGLMAGEGVGGAVNAVMTVVGIGGDRWGTTVGCPAGIC